MHVLHFVNDEAGVHIKTETEEKREKKTPRGEDAESASIKLIDTESSS